MKGYAKKLKLLRKNVNKQTEVSIISSEPKGDKN